MDSTRIVSIVLFVFIRLQHSFGTAAVSSNVHIIYLGERRHDMPEHVEDSHHRILSDILGSKEAAVKSILYSYKHGFSGFAAVLSPIQAKRIADIPGVVCVFPQRILNLHTTRSWDFLQVKSHLKNGILRRAHFGAASIIGVIDSGIWPESESFNDDGFHSVPSYWKGMCQEGEEFNRSNCNRKLVGARWYIKGYEAEFGKLNPNDGIEFLSPRDAAGHGTHTSSTAAGASIEGASFAELAKGLARGGAPLARIAAYKVCWSFGGCSSADILAAFDDAISDGVDLISVSLGSLPPLSSYVEDPVAIGSFHAVTKGIPVVCSAGNIGPSPETVVNTAPWVITVAATTIDRAFPSVITLGSNQIFVGQTLFAGKEYDRFFPIAYGEDIKSADADENEARSCETGSLNATLVKGKVLLCFESRYQRSAVAAARTVQEGQGVGLIFARFLTKEVTMCLDVPCVHVDFTTGTSLLTYIASTSNPIVKFSLPRTIVGQQISPQVALFSSRGPNSLSPTVLKPDIAAPGVDILASWSPASSDKSLDSNKTQLPNLNFKIVSGTSMACPHISAIVALLRAIHPTWSPAAIKSALVTTASLTDQYGQNAVAEGAPPKQADPFDYGGGHVDANKALDPGLIYDMDRNDYAQFLCSMGYNKTAISWLTRSLLPCHAPSNFLVNLNLPSITIPALQRSLQVSRTVTNVGPVVSIYTARIQAPPGIKVRVEPSLLLFNSSVNKAMFKVTLCSKLSIQGSHSFGNLFWEDGHHVVRIPLIVRTIIPEFQV
nr:subtilisin-like protease SBT3.9 isoform X1 [Ipomoea batatas]